MSDHRQAVLDRISKALWQDGAPVGEGDRNRIDQWSREGDAEASYFLASMAEKQGAPVGDVLRRLIVAAKLGYAQAAFSVGWTHWLAFDEDHHGLKKGRGNERIAPLLEGGEPPGFDDAADPETLPPMARRARAVYWLRRAALADDVQAASTLAGIVFRSGEEHRPASIPLYELALKRGDASSAQALGNILKHGQGVPADPARADDCYRQARELYEAGRDDDGELSTSVLITLGDFHHRGDGTPRDAPRAIEYWEQAAARNNAWAMCKLGNLYADGEGVPRDLERAEAWFRKAIAAGDAHYAQSCIDNLPRKRAEAETEAWAEMPQEELERLAAGGDFRAMGKLIVRLDEAGEVQAALSWMERAALMGNKGAAMNLARRYEMGLMDAPVDAALALKWTRYAACLGEPIAMFRYAEQLLTVEYGKPKPIEAYAWLMLIMQERFVTAFAAFRDLARERAAGLAPSLTAEQLQQAEAMVSACDGSKVWPGA